jgi:hypothetical protein
MSLSNKKVLVSGCGFSFGGQERKTWVNVLKSVGVRIVDVGGPAVSNQWILNQAFLKLLEDDSINQVILQLTSTGKLDVEVNAQRQEELVEPDSLRNFTFQGIWPSSYSVDHKSKRLYNQWLVSPGLEAQDVFCKIMLLQDWCQSRNIKFTVMQAYDMPWTELQKSRLNSIILNIADPLYDQYERSEHYQYHDHANHNSVPCEQYQIDLAADICERIDPVFLPRIQRISRSRGVRSSPLVS